MLWLYLITVYIMLCHISFLILYYVNLFQLVLLKSLFSTIPVLHVEPEPYCDIC